MKKINVLNSILTLLRYLGKEHRLQFIFLLILMLCSVIAEIISIGAIVPFLSALTEPEVLFNLTWFQPIIKVLDIHLASELLFPLTLGFVLAAVFAAVIRITLLWVNTRLSASMGIQLRSDIYARTLHQPYAFHIAHNSSHLIALVTEKVGLAIYAGIMHSLLLVTAFLTSFAIIVTLLLINAMVAILAFVILGGGYILIAFLVRKHIKKNGDTIAINQPHAVKCIQEGLGGIRDIIIDDSHNVFTEKYSKVANKILLARMQNAFFGGLPKSLLEMVAIIVIAIMAYYLQTGDSTQVSVLPILGALALGTQRLLPTLQQIYFSWTTISSSEATLKEVVSYLEEPKMSINLEKTSLLPLNFRKKIELKNVYFQYSSSEAKVLKDINMDIAKGTRIGFIGTTGSGKSTLLDTIMGLLSPTKGQILIDSIPLNKKNISNWMGNIAHVPQSIFLSDTSIAENIAFGVTMNEIDFMRVKQAAKQANIDKYIDNLPEGYNTYVGERGVQLSGGQRQRIGIARALYKQANVIVFDEATSALDDETETSVMEAINSLNKELTVLIIAHRLSTLKGCDLIYKLDQGVIVESGAYEKIIMKNG